MSVKYLYQKVKVKLKKKKKSFNALHFVDRILFHSMSIKYLRRIYLIGSLSVANWKIRTIPLNLTTK